MPHQRFQRFDLNNQSNMRNRYTVTVGYFDILAVEHFRYPTVMVYQLRVFDFSIIRENISCIALSHLDSPAVEQFKNS